MSHAVLVDPGKLTLNFQSSDPPGPSAPEVSRRARGVITVTVRGSPPGTKSQYQSKLCLCDGVVCRGIRWKGDEEGGEK